MLIPHTNPTSGVKTKIIWIIIFGITMAVFEAVVVVYLRKLYYPEGFSFPLKLIPQYIIYVEIAREIAAILMVVSVSVLASSRFYEGINYFLIIFGVWDIFYYIWLKIFIEWPATLADWDVLFLIPLPWIGPVIAPLTVACLMTSTGLFLIHLYLYKKVKLKFSFISWCLIILAIGLILYSFMYDTSATLYQEMPKPYKYNLLIIAELVYVSTILLSIIKLYRH